MDDVQDKSANLSILLIGDNPDDEKFLEHNLRLIKNKKFQIESCALPSSSLARLAAGGIDIVFFDLSLPDSFGIEALIKMHQRAPTIPIVVLTGTNDDGLASLALRSGAQDYLVKAQLNPSTLVRSINYAIERQRSFEVSQRLVALVECSHEAIIAKSLDNIILSWNKGAERIYGYEAGEVIGKSINILMPADLPNDCLMILEEIKQGERIENYETRRRRKDGTQVVVSISVSPIRYTDGVITGASIIARDMTQERHTELALRLTDERLHLAVSVSKIGLWDWNIGDGKVLWDSNSYKLFGVSEGQFIPSFETFLECVYPDDRLHVKQSIENALLSADEFGFNFRIVWPDGSIHYEETKGQVFFDRHNQPVRMTGICLDVTEHQLDKRALQDSKQRLQLALESAKMGVWDLDLVNDTVWRSLKHDEIFGYESMLPEWSYAKFLEHVLPEDRQAVQEKLDLALKNGNFKIECRIVHAGDKSVRWIAAQGESYKNDQGAPIRLMGAVMDITDEKQLQQQIEQVQLRREQISHSIVQNAPIGIVILDADLTVIDANAAFAAMIHRDLQQLLNQPLIDILPGQLLLTAEDSVKNGEQLQVSRLPVTIPIAKSQLQCYWDLSLWPVSEDGQLAGAVLQIVDCTDTVILEQQRDNFVASVAHDIKNPLIGAERILDSLCSNAQNNSPEYVARMLSVLRDNNQNLVSLVQNLVDVYRYEAIPYSCQYEDVDLAVLVASCIEQIKHFAESHNVTVKSKMLEAPAVIEADALGIRRVLMNLLHNAVKFNKQGGAVEITIQRGDKVVKLSVTDTGSGISDSDRQKLFQRFAQGKSGKRFTSGTGLGLYLSREIVEAHHGTISCEGKVASGTTFVVALPIKKPGKVADLVKE